MASHGSRSPSPSAHASSRRTKSCARRCERACCAVATYFPLAFVYSITTWAVWVDARIGFHRQEGDKQIPYSKKIPSAIGVILYILLNASYTVAVFTNPGSPNNSDPSHKRGKYSVLPTSEPHDHSDIQTITVSSSGSARYCKKCHVSKPDRTHHCSTCKRCVLKMDHHCPWLATCLGLHNYKAFVLFLIYVSVFCWACFFNTGFWIWHEIFEANKYLESFAPVNVILLAVLSGIIGLVISGFTGWHLFLCVRGQTTIECLEKTRYLSGVRKQVEANRQEHANTHSRHGSESLANNLKRIGDQVLEFHANAVPGASRFEEGEEHTSPAPTERRFSDLDHTLSTPPHHQPQTSHSESPAQRALRTNYQAHEQQRESDRYEEYLLDQDSSKLPNAFDLGWKRNLMHVFGPSPLLWWLPICNSTGDGWRWEVSETWVRANEEVTRQREERLRNAQQQQQHQYVSDRTNIRGGGAARYYDDTSSNNNSYTSYDYQHTGPATNSFPARSYNDSALSMHTLNRPQSGQGAGKMRRDFDRGADGEVGHFEVSGSEDEQESDSDDDIGQMGSRSRRGRRRDNDEWEGTW